MDYAQQETHVLQWCLTGRFSVLFTGGSAEATAELSPWGGVEDAGFARTAAAADSRFHPQEPGGAVIPAHG